MPRRKSISGVIDPISLIGVLFLIVTLVVGTKVTNDRSMSLNISEKAADCFDECRQDSGRKKCNEQCGTNINWRGENVIDTSKVDKDADPKAPTCDANGVQYSPGTVVMYGGIGSNATCGSDGKWDVGVGATTDIIPENLPEYAKESDKLKNQIESEKPIAEAEKQAAEQLAQQELKNQQIEEIIIPQQNPIQPKEQQPVTTTTTQTNPFANVTAGVSGRTKPSVITSTQVGQPCTNCHLSPAQQTVTQVINNKLVTGTVETNPPLRINPLESLKDLGVDLKADITTPDKYAGCTGNACNVTKSLIDDLLINDKYKNYWQEQTAKAKPEDNLLDIAFNQQTVLDTADTVFFDKFTPYVANYQRINEETYDPNRNDVANYLDAYVTGGLDAETRKATVDLGKVITAELATAYALPVIAGSGGLLPTAGATFGQFGAITTSNQIVNAGEECIRNGVKDEQCLKDSARAAFSLLTLGTSQAANTVTKLAGYSDEAVFLAKGANTIVSGGNLAVDSGDVIDTCTKFGSNQSSFGCTMSYIALVGDIAGLGADYKHGQLSFGGSKVDVPDINGTRIANAEELARTMNVKNVDMPKTLDTPSVPKKTFTEIVGNFLFGNPVPKNIDAPINDLLPPSKVEPSFFEKLTNDIKPMTNELTGMDVTNPKLAEKIYTDQASIRKKYNLPDYTLRETNPQQHLNDLKNIALENKVEVKDISEYPEFFKENPHAGAVHFSPGDKYNPTNNHVVALNLSEVNETSLAQFEHELVHALQPSDMPIETKEYEAYLTQYAGKNYDNTGARVELFGMNIYTSTNTGYQLIGQKMPERLTANADISKFPVEKLTIPQKFTTWVKTEMDKTNPNAFKNIGFELRSPISADGKLQLPFEKVNTPISEITVVEPKIGFAKVLTGSVPTGVGFSPLKYVAGGIASAVFLDDYFNWGIIDYIQNNFVSTINHVYSDNEKKTIGVKLDSSKLESIKPEKIIVASQKSEKSVQDIRPSECVNKEILDTAIVGGDTGLRYDSKFKPDVVVINDIINNATYDRWVPAELAPEAVGPVKEWTQWINDQGYSPFISSGYRSYETQEAYSRSYGNQAATPGGSCHQSGLCFDVHFYVDNKTGKRYDLCYDPNLPECLININAQKKAQELGIAHPYEWDQPHYMVAVAASPAILPFVQQQSIRQTYIDQLNDELLNLQAKCNQYVSIP